MQTPQTARLLQESAQNLGLLLEKHQEQVLLAYLTQLQRWNRTYNLTAIRDPQRMLVQHLLDSLSVIAPLRRQWPQAIHVLDAGSGAGLPGLVIAIMQPQWRITCVDAVQKKVAFMQQAARSLRLDNVLAIHARVETLHHVTATCVISRAFAALHDFVRLAGARVAASGMLVAMKGKLPDAEIQLLAQNADCADWRVHMTEPLSVPLLDAQRCLVWLQRRQAETQGAA